MIEPQTLVVVGNGMMSWRLCQDLVDSGAIEHLRVVVVGEEPLPAYDRVRLTSLLGGARIADLLLSGEEWYAHVGIELHLGERVTEIDRDDCRARTSTGREIFYDRLVLATGSTPFVPPIPGADRPGVLVYRTVDDVHAVAQHAEGRRRAVVLGGGLLGLEAAKAVRDLGLEVTVIERGPGLMGRQLDAEGAKHLEAQIVALGVSVRTATQVVAIDDGLVVRCGDGAALPADLVIVAAGIRPAVELARAAGLEMAANGGVVVDDTLQTSDDRIFAVGECAAHEGTSYGLVAPGYQMVRTLLANLAGAPGRFRPQLPATRLKLLGVHVASVGEADGGPGALAVRHVGPAGYRKLVLRDGRLVGAVAVGAWSGFDRVAQAAQANVRVGPADLRRFRDRGELYGMTQVSGVSQWTADTVVCVCLQVTRCQIEAARAAGGSTPAGTMCGSCKPLVRELEALVPLPTLPRPTRRCPSVTLTPVPQDARPRRTTMPPFRAVPASLPGTTPVPPLRQLRERGAWILGALAVAALALVALLFGAPPAAAATLLPKVELTARAAKLYSGYTTLGLAAASLMLSARKRWRRFAVGDVAVVRTVHVGLGLASLATLLVHTELSLGANLNRALLLDYLGAAALGAVAATVHALPLGPLAARQQRRGWSRLHVLILFPLPVLVVLHIISAYCY